MRGHRPSLGGVLLCVLLLASLTPAQALAAPSALRNAGVERAATQTVGAGSCNGPDACLGATANIGDNSCNGIRACAYASGDIGDGSCIDDEACRESSATIGDGSCTWVKACYKASGTIGDNACNGGDSCTYSSKNIANGTCNQAYECVGTGRIVYVTPAGAGSKNGGSWSNAYDGLGRALGNAETGDQIWVKKGTYRPPSLGDSDPRFRTFVIWPAVSVFGGFAGTESALDQRNWRANPVILSGDVGTHGQRSDNAYHVVLQFEHSRLDGVTVTGGLANEDDPFEGIGGGIIVSGQAEIRNLIVTGNEAEFEGGGLFVFNSELSGENLQITGNKAGTFGGGIAAFESDQTLTNVTISGNYAGIAGGGIYNCDCSQTRIRNSILWNNANGQMENAGSAGVVVFRNSIVQGGLPPGTTNGGGNLASDPKFMAPAGPGVAPTQAGDYHLGYNSPAINKGANSVVPAGLGRDLDNEKRFVGGTVDIGALEWQPTRSDAQLRRQDGPLIGNNIYNTTGSGQTFNGSPTAMPVGSYRVFYIYGQNDSGVADQLRFKANGAEVPGYAVSYWTNSGNDVTSQVKAGTFKTPPIAPGGTYGLTVRINIVTGAQPGSTLDRLFLVYSVRNVNVSDATRLILRRQ